MSGDMRPFLRCADCAGRGCVDGAACDACLGTGRTLDAREYLDLACARFPLSDTRAGRTGVQDRPDGAVPDSHLTRSR